MSGISNRQPSSPPMSVRRKINEFKESQKPETAFEILRKILPERERWRLETLKIIAESMGPINSSQIVRSLRKLGLKTGVGSVHPFLGTLIEAGLCCRKKEWEMYGQRGFKGVMITDKGVKLIRSLTTFLDNSSSSN